MKPVSIAVPRDAVVPLDRWLATALGLSLNQPVPRGLVRKAIVNGLVAVGGRTVRDPGLMLRRGPSVFVRSFDWLPPMEANPKLRVLFEDEWLLAVDKPAGLPTHETMDPARPSLTQLVEGHVGRRVFVHHRLDAGTSGVVLFAKAAEANAPLAKSFAERDVEKTYVALVSRPPIDWPDPMIIDSPMAILSNGQVRVDSAGLSASTHVRVLERSRDLLLVEAKPISGRKHQIRVHLASAGAPVLGDLRYGGSPAETKRLMLHAERLAIAHPVTGKRLVLFSARPEEFAIIRPADRAKSVPLSQPTRPHRPAADPPRGQGGHDSRPGGKRSPPPASRKGRARQRPGRAGARGSRR